MADFALRAPFPPRGDQPAAIAALVLAWFVLTLEQTAILGLAGTGLDGRQGIGGGQTQIVVGMHLKFNIGRPTQPGDTRTQREGFHHTDGIGKTETARAAALDNIEHLQQESGIGT